MSPTVHKKVHLLCLLACLGFGGAHSVHRFCSSVRFIWNRSRRVSGGMILLWPLYSLNKIGNSIPFDCFVFCFWLNIVLGCLAVELRPVVELLSSLAFIILFLLVGVFSLLSFFLFLFGFISCSFCFSAITTVVVYDILATVGLNSCS